MSEKYTLCSHTSEPYKLMMTVKKKHHTMLEEAHIALAFYRGWRPDADGRLTLGKCRRVTELDKELHGHDFIVVLNEPVWEGSTDKQRRALIHHELCHARPAMKGNEIECEPDGSPKWRHRKHEVEEFSEVVEIYGMWTKDLEEMGKQLLKHTDSPLFVEAPRDLRDINEDDEETTDALSAPTDAPDAPTEATADEP